MRLIRSLPIGFAILLSVVAAALIGAAMLLGDKSEELIHALGDPARPTRPTPSFPGATEVVARWRGLGLVPGNSPIAKQLGLEEVESGVIVSEVGDASRATGLAVGDVVVGVDRQPVRDLASIYGLSRATPAGMPVLLDVRRRDQAMTLVLPAEVAAAPSPAAQAGGYGVPAAFGTPQLFCPRDRLVLPQRALSPPYTCPYCRGPMHWHTPPAP